MYWRTSTCTPALAASSAICINPNRRSGTSGLRIQFDNYPHRIVIAPRVLLPPVGAALETGLQLHSLKRPAK